MRKFLLVILILSFSFAGVRAQSTIHFYIDTFGIFNQFHGDTVSISDSLYFTGGQRASNIALYGMVNSVLLPQIDSLAGVVLDTPANARGYKIPIIRIPVTPNFQIGPNLIVIWPVYRGGAASLPIDTISFIVNVLQGAGIDESPLARLYLIQMDGAMFINFGDAEKFIQRVRLYDIEGREIYTDAADRSRRIPTGQWQSGIYFCEITTISGQRRVIKLKIE